METFLGEFQNNCQNVIPKHDFLKSESSTFVKTPFDFTLYNIWNAVFVESEWNSKFTFPNFVIDQQSGILVTTLATLLAAFCDKKTRDRMAFVADEISKLSCCEQFCCPSLFYLIKLIVRRANNPPPRKTLKTKLKHINPKVTAKLAAKQLKKEQKKKKKTEQKNKKKTEQKNNLTPAEPSVTFKNTSQPETCIKIEDDKMSLPQERLMSRSPHNVPKQKNFQTNSNSLDEIQVIVDVHSNA